MKKPFCAALALLTVPALAGATGLDINTEYRMRATSYENINLNLNDDATNNRSFISQSARLGMAFKDIHLSDAHGVSETMDIFLKLRALGATGFERDLNVAGYSTPFDRIAAHYPNTDFTPFFENAYIRAHNLAGWPWELSFGQQSFSLGSGLLLDDDGAGLTGIQAQGSLPWGGLKAQGFIFQAQRRPMIFSPAFQEPATLNVFGFTLELPLEGTWQLHQLIERDQTTQFVAPNGCKNLNANGCLVSGANRWFSSVRYRLAWGPMVFDGEAAVQKGAATPTTSAGNPVPAGNHITFNGNAQLIRAKWKQTFFTSKSTGRKIRGIARLSLARGSGDDASTPTTDEAFYPSHGHRFDGMERAGMGYFYGATPYDAFGGKSTATASGLPPGASGVIAVGVGVTPPAWHGIVFDFDYYLYQADKNVGNSRTLGTEYDLTFRYDIRDRFQLRAIGAFFEAGPASNPTKGKSKLYRFEAVGRF